MGTSQPSVEAPQRRLRPFHALDGSPALIRERLRTLETVLQSDPRPALLFEHGRLVAANDSARRVLRPSSATDVFLKSLKAALSEGVVGPGVAVRVGGHILVPELHPARARSGQSPRICILVRAQVATPTVTDVLSKREVNVLTWLIKGLTNAEIGDRLGISVETVRKHVAHALFKTKCRTRVELVGRALEE